MSNKKKRHARTNKSTSAYKNARIDEKSLRRRSKVSATKMKRGILQTAGFVLMQAAFLLLLILTASLIWVACNYGNIGMEQIVFTLNMPLKGTSSNYFISYGLTLVPAILLFLLEHLLLKRRVGICSKLWSFVALIIIVVWGVILFLVADNQFGLSDYLEGQLSQSSFIKDHYVDPSDVAITFPEKKRNLIMIYMESGESSAQDVADGGLFEDTNYIPEMTEIAKNNISFSQSDLIEGASVAPACGWTMAGLVAETTGLPLKLFTYDDSYVDNSMGHYEYFMPGATSLGDILEEQGYKNVFMAGSDFDFGGRTNYFTQHGDYEICDLKWARSTGLVPEDYTNGFWGFDDSMLYSFAKDKLTELASSDQPFNFSMLTVDTHQPNGYVCDLCQNEYADQYGNVWSCASRQVASFLEWIQQQDFYENTTVVIVGDHCSMNQNFYGLYTQSADKHNGSTVRKVYNAFINSSEYAADEKNRQFTTLDYFPTILASLGVEIDGDRLGLGTNLFSDTQTLSEEYGYDDLFTELNKRSVFYNNTILYP